MSWPTGPSYYLLCGNPRVGSSLWAQVLRSTGRLGDPVEPFHEAAEAELRAEWGLLGAPYEQFLRTALERTRTPGGGGGVKLMWAYLDQFLQRLATVQGLTGDGIERFGTVFAGARAIHLTRRNKGRAAISNWIALTNDQWVLWPGVDVVPPPDAVDLWAVTRLHAELHAAEIGWPAFLAIAGIPSVTEFYEDWSAQPRVEVSRRSRPALGIDIDEGTIPDPLLLVQSTAFNDVVEATWTERTGGCPACQG